MDKTISGSDIAEKPDLPASQKCGFYRLQKRLREEGWYVEWTDALQLGHAWVDMPSEHYEGPFKGIEIDETKCLVCCIGDPSDLLEPPENISPEEFQQWYELADEKLESGDMDGLAEIAGQKIVDKFLNPLPEVWGGNVFMFDPKGIENLNAALSLFESNGCRYRQVSECTIWIEWDTR